MDTAAPLTSWVIGFCVGSSFQTATATSAATSAIRRQPASCVATSAIRRQPASCVASPAVAMAICPSLAFRHVRRRAAGPLPAPAASTSSPSVSSTTHCLGMHWPLGSLHVGRVGRRPPPASFSSSPSGYRDLRPRRLLPVPMRASNSSSDTKKKKNNGRRDLYILLAVCLVTKLYSVFQNKVKALFSDKNYIAIAMTVFAILKAVYESFKLAKDIRELVKYYRSSKKTDTK